MFFWFYAATGRRFIAETVDQSVVTGFFALHRPGTSNQMRRDGRSALEPYTALALFAGTALFYVVGSSLFGRD